MISIFTNKFPHFIRTRDNLICEKVIFIKKNQKKGKNLGSHFHFIYKKIFFSMVMLYIFLWLM